MICVCQLCGEDIRSLAFCLATVVGNCLFLYYYSSKYCMRIEQETNVPNWNEELNWTKIRICIFLYMDTNYLNNTRTYVGS